MATDKLINQTQGADIIDALSDIATNVGNITYGPQTSADKVVSMTGYQKASAEAAISEGDTLNQAIGKLEKKADDNATDVAGKIDKLTNATAGDIATVTATGEIADSEVAIETTLSDSSDAKVPTSKAVGTYVDGKGYAVGVNSSTANNLVAFNDANGKALKDSGIAVAKSSTGLTDSDTAVPTSKTVKTYVDSTATGISRYLGTITAASGLSTSAKKGDFYVVKTAWTGVHAGDEIIAEKDNPAQTIDGTNWSLLHNEADTDTKYTFATGDSNGTFKVTPSDTGTAQSVPIKGLGNAAYKGVATSVSTSEDLVTSKAVNTKLASYVPNSDFVVAENNIEYTINAGGKNLLSKFQYYDNADKVTVNADGSITLNVASSSYDINIHFALDSDGVDRYKPMPVEWVGKYFSGMVTANNALIWIMELSDDGSTWKRQLNIGTVNQKLEIPNDGYYKFTLKIAKNNVVSNYTFKPMIADEIVYDTIGTGQPPALPNSNLTLLEAEDRTALAEEIDAGPKNKYIPRAQTQAGITATVNNDNSLNVTWTAIGSSNEYCRINDDNLKLPVGTYVFSGLTESGDLNYYLHLEDSSGTIIGNIMSNTPNRCLEFNVTDATKSYKVYVAVVANSAAQSTAKKIYPMICTKAAFAVSPKFVPYAKSNYSLTQDKLNRCSKQLTSGSLNDIKDNEIYYAAADVTDMPTSARAWGFVRTTMYGTDKLYGMQEFFSVTDPCESYFRVLRNGTWQSWVKTGG